MVIYPFFKVIHKHNFNEISFDWYNRLVFMRTGCEIKSIETQTYEIWEKEYLLKYIILEWRKLGWLFYIGTQWI